MREILFRAKRIDNGEWVEGLVTIIWGQLHMTNPLDENTAYPIDSETVCQYTGITDKKSKKIFEGDILMCHNNKNDLVKAVFGSFAVIDVETLEKVDEVVGWHYEVITTDEISKCEPFNTSMPLTETYIKRCGMEIIGNIFDNPKLKGDIKE